MNYHTIPLIDTTFLYIVCYITEYVVYETYVKPHQYSKGESKWKATPFFISISLHSNAPFTNNSQTKAHIYHVIHIYKESYFLPHSLHFSLCLSWKERSMDTCLVSLKSTALMMMNEHATKSVKYPTTIWKS